jgi:hypothetical protein
MDEGGREGEQEREEGEREENKRNIEERQVIGK